jgi:hypothetical protein
MHPRPLRRLLVAALAAAATAVPLLAPPAQAADPAWVEGTSDSDTITSCVTGEPETGVMASVAWRPLGDHVPYVGERFALRVTVGMVGLPCSGQVASFVELMAPEGLTYADDDAHPVTWALHDLGEDVALRPGGLAYHPGSNGGVVVLQEGDEPFVLRRGQVLELEVPVAATRVMKGMATRQPECLDRRNGVRPCPAAESGDHVQAAVRVGGHGGSKYYVTPYVGLFAQEAPRPPAAQPSPAAVPSRTSATFRLRARTRPTATVAVSSSVAAPTGRVTVTDRGKVVGRAVLRPGDRGRVVVRLSRLARGKHVLRASYGGSAAVGASASAPRTVRVR